MASDISGVVLTQRRGQRGQLLAHLYLTPSPSPAWPAGRAGRSDSWPWYGQVEVRAWNSYHGVVGHAPVLTREDARFRAPILTPNSASVHLGIPRTTISEWVGRARDSRPPLMHSVPPEIHSGPSLPFIALAEAQILRELRATGLSMQEIRAGVHRLRTLTGQEYVLATHDIATDGGHLLYQAAQDVAPAWIHARDGQAAFRLVVEKVARYVRYSADGFADQLALPRYGSTDVIIDPEFAFGQPVLARSKIRVETIVDLFYAGESIKAIADEYDVAKSEVESVLRVLARPVA